jgi:hypothetical protein
VNQNKGIGAYQNRPGYFMGGMIGGAILGALVNKIQGKDWKRGALMGGITGGFMGSSHMAGVLGKMKPGLMKNLLTTGGTQYGGTAALSPLAKYGIPAAVTYMAGDPEYDKKKMDEAMMAESEERKRKNIEMYPDWYKNFFPGFFNRGGMIDGRLGYYDGGPAGGPFSDVPMEEPGPTMDPEIMRLPMGQEGTFEEENEGILGLELAGLSDSEKAELQGLMSLRLITPKDDPKYPQIEMRIQELMQGIGGETAMSEPHPDEGAYDMFFNEFGRYPKDREELQIFMDELDLDVPAAASGGLMRLHAKQGLWANIHAKRKRIEGGSGEKMRSPGSKGAPTAKALRESQATGGYMERPGYMGGGISDIHPETEDEGYTYDIDNRKYHFDELLPEDEEERKMLIARLLQARENAGEDRIMVDDLKGRLLADNVREAMARRNPMAFRAQGGIMGYYGGGMSDMDLTNGGASFGAGTGTSDDIPAMLSDGEFVVTAKAVENLGGGNRMLGAKKMYQMMNQLDPNSQTPAEMDTTGIA